MGYMGKVLVTGAKGQLGQELQGLAITAKMEFVFTDQEELDITDQAAVMAFFDQHKPQYCINCAAYTQVDKAEQEEKLAYQINEQGATNLALASHKNGAVLLQISTDFVFGGTYNQPISEYEEPQAESVYASSKLAGERAVAALLSTHIIIRTSWLYSFYGGNFVKTMRRLGKERNRLTVIADQIGAPTYAQDLAKALIHIVNALDITDDEGKKELYGVYHYSNEGVASWYDFAHAVMALSNINTSVLPIATEAYPTPAKRPRYSLLDKRKIKQAFKINIPHWRDSLNQCIQRLESESS